MSDAKSSYYFISHTHWDREWYLPFERFRYRLVQLIDHLLELLDADPSFTCFHLDGQTIVLEDYLKIRPSQRERLEAHIRSGRILIGPWYQQNDLFLTSGESTVRNLMEGISQSRALGGEMKVGYLPDHFGLIGQMPQIFRGIGLNNTVFGRGYAYDKHGSSYIHWRSPDGSEVTGILMAHWYNNAQRLPEDREELKHLFVTMKAREESTSSIPHHLMMNGVDHLEVQENLPHVLQILRELFGDEHHFIQDALPNYVQTVIRYIENNKSLSVPVIEGELREREEHNILGGTLSSRVYLKQANVECHNLLEKWIEPLSAWCAMKGLDPYDGEYIRSVWKMYMENHPHDSICGCSQDAVHDHMMDRFASIKEVAEDIIDRKLEVLARQIQLNSSEKGDQKLLVVNTSQLPSSAVIQTTLYFLAEDEVTDFRLEDEQGHSMAYRLVLSKPSRIQVLSPINLPGVLQVQRFDIEWQPKVPAMGYATYRVRSGHQGTIVVDHVQSAAPVLENDRIKVEFQANGTFNMTDKRSGSIARGLGAFADAGDRGYLYVFKHIAGEK